MDSRIAEFLRIVQGNLLLTSLQENQAQVQDYMQTYSQDFTSPKTTLQQKDSKMVQRLGFLQVPLQIDLASIIDQLDKAVIQESRVRTEFLKLITGLNHLKMKTVVFLIDFMVEAKKEMLQRKDNKIQCLNGSQLLPIQELCQDNSQIVVDKTLRNHSSSHN